MKTFQVSRIHSTGSISVSKCIGLLWFYTLRKLLLHQQNLLVIFSSQSRVFIVVLGWFVFKNTPKVALWRLETLAVGSLTIDHEHQFLSIIRDFWRQKNWNLVVPVALRTPKKYFWREKVYSDLRFQGKKSSSKTRDLRGLRVKVENTTYFWANDVPDFTSELTREYIRNSIVKKKHSYIIHFDFSCVWSSFEIFGISVPG